MRAKAELTSLLSLPGHQLQELQPQWRGLLPSPPPTTSWEAENLQLALLGQRVSETRNWSLGWAGVLVNQQEGPGRLSGHPWDLLWVLGIRSVVAPAHYFFSPFPQVTSSLLSFTVGASQADKCDWGWRNPCPRQDPALVEA